MLKEPIYQMAFLVADIADAADHWHRQSGAGPFFLIDHFPFLDPVFAGKPAAPDISIALGYCGDVMLELIRVHDDAPSPFTLGPRPQPGEAPMLHHVAQLTRDMSATRARMAGAGAPTLFTARFAPDTPCAFIDTRRTIGCLTEVITATPDLLGLQAVMQEQTTGWSGDRLLRTF